MMKRRQVVSAVCYLLLRFLAVCGTLLIRSENGTCLADISDDSPKKRKLIAIITGSVAWNRGKWYTYFKSIVSMACLLACFYWLKLLFFLSHEASHRYLWDSYFLCLYTFLHAGQTLIISWLLHLNSVSMFFFSFSLVMLSHTCTHLMHIH